jgi:peptidoglycan LD-endopeptidase CwlK
LNLRRIGLACFLVQIASCVTGFAQNRVEPDGGRLRRAYPDYIAAVRDNRVIWTDGTTTVFDDGYAGKDWLTLLRSPDIEDQLALAYPDNPPPGFRPATNADPGRLRCPAFFEKMYGATMAAVTAKLAIVRWLPSCGRTPVLMTRVNGVDKKLALVSAELEKLPAEFLKYLVDPGGGFSYRTVRDTERPSPHSYGIAFDLNPALTDYWKDAYRNELDKVDYRNRLPLEIVKVFEKHGFIWGGRWYHYDTMHFEYRPELLPAID